MLNGRRVDGKAVIENGDIITIGNIPLKFECDDALSQKSRTQLRSQVQTAPNTVAYGVLVDVKTKRPVYLKKRRKDLRLWSKRRWIQRISSEFPV